MVGKDIPFFLDQNVPDSVGRFLLKSGHDVIYLRQCMPTDTKDPVIAIACAANGRVLVTHDRDFRAISKRLSMTKRNARKLHRISLHCLEPNSVERVKEAISIIEFEWRRPRSGANQMIIEISNVAIRVVR